LEIVDSRQFTVERSEKENGGREKRKGRRETQGKGKDKAKDLTHRARRSEHRDHGGMVLWCTI
jgi:hypothetical protein